MTRTNERAVAAALAGGDEVVRSIRAQLVRELLETIDGEDDERDGLAETPRRFARAFEHYTSGYAVDPATLLKSFEEADYDQLVIVRDIPFYSLCEHHLAPFFGTATVAYKPTGRVVGLSKLARLVEVFARRLQVQERMTRQIAHALWESEELSPAGVSVVLRARHLCMESRGVQKPGATTVTSEVLGMFRDDFRLRAEFVSLAEVSR